MDSKFENIHSFTEILHLVSYQLLSNLVRQTLGGSNMFRKTTAFALRSTTLKSSIPAYDQRTITLSYLKNVNIPTANTAQQQNLKENVTRTRVAH